MRCLKYTLTINFLALFEKFNASFIQTFPKRKTARFLPLSSFRNNCVCDDFNVNLHLSCYNKHKARCSKKVYFSKTAVKLIHLEGLRLWRKFQRRSIFNLLSDLHKVDN